MNDKKKLPWVCPEHPRAQIRHEWDETHFVMGGLPVGTGTKAGHKYYCAECGRELAAQKDEE